VYPLSWPDINSHFGAFDIAGFAKDGVGYYKAWWYDWEAAEIEHAVNGNSSAATGSNSISFAACTSLSISPSHWSDPVPLGTAIDVTVTTCAATAELYLNGKLLMMKSSDGRGRAGRYPMPRFEYLQWSVPYTAGNLTAVAYDEAGEVLARHSVVTAGTAHSLEAWIESPYTGRGGNSSEIVANGQDAALVGVRLLDALGNLVPNADVNVSFSIQGPATVVGVANGDPADHGPDKAEWRRTFHGLARCIIASSMSGATGNVVLTASAAGVQPSHVVLQAVAAD
jgi:beta-galactosidase